MISAGASTVYGGVGTSTNVAALTGIWSAVLVDGTTVYQSATGTSVTTVSRPIALDDNAILYVTNGATASGIEDAGGALGYIYVNSGGTLADSKITYDLVTVYAGGKTTGNTFAGYAEAMSRISALLLTIPTVQKGPLLHMLIFIAVLL